MSETTWEYTVQDTSPMFHYSRRDGGSTITSSNLDPTVWHSICPDFPAPGLATSPICDVNSWHYTASSGASVSLPFFGQEIQLFGSITGNVSYETSLDNSIAQGSPNGDILLSASNLHNDWHTVNLTIKSVANDGGFSSLNFSKAIITVGTGLTNATITHDIIQDIDPRIQYIGRTFLEKYDTFQMPQSSDNTTWTDLWFSQNQSAPAKAVLLFSGDAIFVYGTTWAGFNTSYGTTIDNGTTTSRVGASSLSPHNASLTNIRDQLAFDLLYFFDMDLSNGPHTFTMDNANGTGRSAIDYIEVVTVSGGSPFKGPPSGSQSQQPLSKSHKTSIGVIVGPVIGGLALLLILITALLWYRRRRRQRSTNSAHSRRTSRDVDRLSPTPWIPDDDDKSRTPTSPLAIETSHPSRQAVQSPNSAFLQPQPTTHSPTRSSLRPEIQELRREVDSLHGLVQGLQAPPQYSR